MYIKWYYKAYSRCSVVKNDAASSTTNRHPSKVHHFKYKIHDFNAKSTIFHAKSIVLNSKSNTCQGRPEGHADPNGCAGR